MPGVPVQAVGPLFEKWQKHAFKRKSKNQTTKKAEEGHPDNERKT